MNHVDDPSCVDSLVNHLSSWKPLETAVVKAPDGGGKPSAAAAVMKTTNSESEGRVDDEAIGDATTKSVELEESAAVEMEAIATDDASMEISSAEAPTTVDCFTQTEPIKVPRLVSRRMKIKTEDLIALDKLAFTFKENMQVRKGQNIHGPNGSATRARQRHVNQLISHIVRKDLTPEQLALVLRDASVHKDARLYFKSAGLIDPDEFETLKFMMSQADKFLEKVLKTESAKGRVANERKEMVNSFFTLIGADDATAASNVTVPSKRRRLLVCCNQFQKQQATGS